ncbi:ABC transporter permease [Carboxydochorda subterranea]|uniref:Transport permease protein n=1 Tax=Carboxydichorda subterranea TaxID=3109565 RepID=A0ABZ1BXS9_9FIRM|nr:ABC transporter permease [Limnochorda sp. L945t]WRP17356.1 ABC transporter permease [Limnochorda sp. L945t]
MSGAAGVARLARSPAFYLAAAWIVWRRELLRYRRERSQWFGGVSRAVLWLVVLGFGLGASFRDIEGYTYAQYMLPGVATLNVLFASTQSAIALVWDREVGLMREVLVSPAPVTSVAAGKVLGGATVALIQATIALAFAPVVGVSLAPDRLLLAWAVVFCMGITMTSIGVLIASRMRSFEGFGSISNGVVLPLYFLSGSVFPLKGIIGGVGFLEIPDTLRAELARLGIHALGGGWVVRLPAWLQVLVYVNPVSYQLDLLRYVLLDYQQLPMVADVALVAAAPVLAMGVAVRAMARMAGQR